jgi:hypothetical protein
MTRVLAVKTKQVLSPRFASAKSTGESVEPALPRKASPWESGAPSAGTMVQEAASTPRSQPAPVTFQRMLSSSGAKPVMPVIS